MLTQSPAEPSGHDAPRHEFPDLGAIVGDMLAILRRRLWVLLAVVAVVFGLFVLAFTHAQPKYDATTVVRIDPTPLAANGVIRDQTTFPDQAVVDTEVSTMRSREIAFAVVKRFNLNQDPEFTRGLDKEAGQQRLQDVTTAVLNHLSAARERETYLVDLSFRSADADKAAVLANAFADEYIRWTVARRTLTAKQQNAWLEQRLSALAGQAQASESALAQYKARAGITEAGPNGTVTDQQIAPLTGQLASAQAENASAQSDLRVARAQMASGGAGGASSVLNSAALETLRNTRASVVQSISQLSTRYGPKHPQTVQAEQQLASVDAQIRQEGQRIVGELQAKADAASARAGSLRGDLSSLRAEQAGNARAAAGAETLQHQADANYNAYNQLAGTTQQIEQLSQNQLPQAQIVQRANAPSSPSSPKKGLFLGGGLLIALTLGLGTIAAQEVVSAGIVLPAELEKIAGVKMLAAVPRLKVRREKGSSAADSLLLRPNSHYAETFRQIRNSLGLAAGPRAQIVALVSSVPNEGKSTCALSLARVTALAGERTLLIDGDARRAGLASMIGGTRRAGLIEVLRDGSNLRDALVPDQVDGLDILAPLEGSFQSSDLFGSPAMATLLEEMRQRYSRIVIDTPPLLGIADARVLAALADAVLVVVKWNDTPRKAVKAAIKALRTDGSPIAGTVLTQVAPRSEALGGLYYSKHYANYYQPA